MENKGIQFKKPPDFKSDRVIKLKQEAGYGFLIFLFFLSVVGTVGFVFSGNEELFDRVLMAILAPPFIFWVSHRLWIQKKINNDLSILEISEKGLWISYYNLFIPKERFYKSYRDLELVKSVGPAAEMVGKLKLDRVHVSFMVNKNEYMRLYLTLRIRHKFNLSDEYTLIDIFVPFTTGEDQNIELDIDKDDLVKELNVLSQEIDFSEYGNVGQDLKNYITITPRTFYQSEPDYEVKAANQK